MQVNPTRLIDRMHFNIFSFKLKNIEVTILLELEGTAETETEPLCLLLAVPDDEDGVMPLVAVVAVGTADSLGPLSLGL
jgi:hypothetical protein